MGIADLTDSQGNVCRSDYSKANALKEWFESVYIEENTPSPKVEEKTLNHVTDVTIVTNDIQKRLSNLNVKKSVGPDGISPKILKELSNEIAEVISGIFQESIDEGTVPQLWKKAHVTALFKKGAKSNPSNYRPISLTCILCKVLESIIRTAILDHLTQNNLICKNQYGFVPKRSTSLQLLKVMEEWIQVIDNGGNIDVIYLDVMKAFDQVPKNRLLTKLSSCGIKKNLLQWIDSFLTNRTLTVLVNGCKSGEGMATSGVPQGSVLGPLLFVIYINDLPNELLSAVYMFADDTKMFREMKDNSDHNILQSDLHRLNQWAKDWMLSFHPGKSSVLHLGKTNPQNKYFLNNQELQNSSTEKDLGVIVDDKLKFEEHIQSKISKARQIWGLIRRSITYIDSNTFTCLFKALVRPHLEYANCVWFPATKGQSIDIEKVQRSATKQIPGLSELTYPERLKKLGLPTLKHRRRRGDLIETFKMMTGIYDKGAVPDFERPTTAFDTRGHCYKLRQPASKTNLGHNRFTSRVVTDWNSLPDYVVESESVNHFKNNLDDYFQEDPSVYDYDL